MTTGAVNPRRADTRRNHERILTAAAETLAGSGGISFNAIAKQAGVGVGTVYRHFPTPEALIIAVYRREVRTMVDVVPKLLEKHAPDEAFRIWTVDHLAHYMMTKRGLADALRAATRSEQQLPASAFEAVTGAVATLLKANEEAGTIRPGLEPMTVMLGLGGLLFLAPDEDWRTAAADLTDLVWRGIRADD